VNSGGTVAISGTSFSGGTLSLNVGGALALGGTVTGATVTGRNIALNEGGTVVLTGTYHDVGTSDTEFLTVNWNDGSPLEFLPISGGTFTRTHTLSDLILGASSVQPVSVTVTDDDTGVSNAILAGTLTVADVAPTMTGVKSANTLVEGQTLTVTLTLTDAGVYQTYTVINNWGGNETPTTLTLGLTTLTNSAISQGVVNWDPTTHILRATHQYLDVTGTAASATFPVTATATDGAGVVINTGTVTPTGTVALGTMTLTNSPPVVSTGISSNNINQGDTLTLLGTITDAGGSLDTFSSNINWGAGETATTLTLGTVAISNGAVTSGAAGLVN